MGTPARRRRCGVSCEGQREQMTSFVRGRSASSGGTWPVPSPPSRSSRSLRGVRGVRGGKRGL